MKFELFGYTISDKDQKPKSKKSESKERPIETFEIEKEPGTETVLSSGLFSYYYDFLAVPQKEIDLIKTYRKMTQSPEIDLALTEIRNEIFVFDSLNKRAIDLTFIDSDVVSKSIQEKIIEEFKNVYKVLDFRKKGIEYFMDWYVDGRLYLHKIIDSDSPKDGLKEIVKIDPLKIKKIREIPKSDARGIYNINEIKEYYVYMNRGDISGYDERKDIASQTHALKLYTDSICYVDSGLYDKCLNTAISFLHKAIVPHNNLQLLETSVVIYRVTRAPERRVIYVDVGNLPKNRAEQYMKELMGRFKNKLVYDSETGSISDKRNILSMIEDFWLPRREGSRGTEISTLPGGSSLGELGDLDYFKDKLANSLNIPANRFTDNGGTVIFGARADIDRDEYRFAKFIQRLRQQFSFIFEDLLKSQLVLKNIIEEDDWDDIRESIQWIYTEDNAFSEARDHEIINARVSSLRDVDEYVGKYYDWEWVMTNILRFSEDEINEFKKKGVGNNDEENEENGEDY